MKKLIVPILSAIMLVSMSSLCAAQGTCYTPWVSRDGVPIRTSGDGYVLNNSLDAEDCIDKADQPVKVVVFTVYRVNDLDSKSKSSLENAMSTVFFDFDKYEIRPEGKEKLDELAAAMKANDNYNLVVRGHADETGTEAYNHKLSHQRASAVKGYLTSKGVRGSRLITQGFGEQDPISPWDKLNRRVEFIAITSE